MPTGQVLSIFTPYKRYFLFTNHQVFLNTSLSPRSHIHYIHTSRLGNTTSQIEPLLTTSTAKTLDQDTIMHLTELCMSLLFSLLIPLHHATDRVLHLATRVKSTMCKSHISLHKTSNYKQNHTHSYGLYDLASACFSELISYHFPLCPKCSMNASFLPIFQTHHINFLSLSLYLFL